jgi:hypothetical protein
MDSDLVVVALVLSVTLTLNADVPLAVGVPEMVPVVALSDSPAGKVPAVINQV